MIVRVGIIGCGAITAFAHVPALLRRHGSGVEIAALCDRDLARAERVKSRYKLHAYCSRDAERVIDDPGINAIIIATWPTEHVPLALRAINAGRHVLLQKPLTTLPAETDAIIAAAESTSLNVMALPIMDNVSSLSLLKQVIESGRLGVIRLTRIRTAISGPGDHYQDVRRFFAEHDEEAPPIFGAQYADGGGCLSDMGPYALALLQYLYGPATLLSAIRDKESFETVALLNLRLSADCARSPGGLCCVEVGWAQYTAMEVCSVFGAEGAAAVTLDGRLNLWPLPTDNSVGNDPTPGSGVLPTSPVAGQDEWIDAILQEQKSSFVRSVRQAAWTARLINEAYRMS